MYMVQGWGKRVKLFLNLEKYRTVTGSLRTIMINGKKINEPKEISDALYEFHQTLSKMELSWSEELIQSLLDEVSLPKLNDNQALEWGGVMN